MNAKNPATIKTLIERFDPISGAYNFSTRIIKDYTRKQLIEVAQKIPLPPDSMDLFPARVATADVLYWREPNDKEVISCLTNKIGRQPYYRVGIASLTDNLPIDKKAFSKLEKEKSLDHTNPSYLDEHFSLWDIFFSVLSFVFISLVLRAALIGGLSNPALFSILIALIACDGIIIGNAILHLINAYRGEKIQEIGLEVPYLDDFKTRDLSPHLLLVVISILMVIATFLGWWVLQIVSNPLPQFQGFNPEIYLMYSVSFLVLTGFALMRMAKDMWRDNRRFYRLERQRKKKVLEILANEFHSSPIQERPYYLQLRELVMRKKWWNIGLLPKIITAISVIMVVIPIVIELFTK